MRHPADDDHDGSRSCADLMPLAHWAKGAMALQSVASLLVLGRVVARSVTIMQ